MPLAATLAPERGPAFAVGGAAAGRGEVDFFTAAAAAVSFFLDMVLSSLAFWLQDVWGVESAYRLAERFLNGGLIPLALFPPWLLAPAQAQPFRYTLSFPLEILTDTLPTDGLVSGFAWQAGYVVGLYALYRIQWHYGLRAYSAAGA